MVEEGQERDTGLSEEEIQGLLHPSAGTPSAGGSANEEELLNQVEQAAKEVGEAMTSALTTALKRDQAITIKNLDVFATSSEELSRIVTPGDFAVRVAFTIRGEECAHFFSLEKDVAKKFAGFALDREVEDEELDEEAQAALTEVFTTLAGAVANRLGKLVGESVEIGEVAPVAVVEAGGFEELGESFFHTTYLLEVDGEELTLYHFIPRAHAVALSEAGAPQVEMSPLAGRPEPDAGQAAGASEKESEPTVKRAVFEELSPSTATTQPRNIDILLDVPMEITVELGRTQVPIQQILEFGQGSLITLDKLAGEPVDLLVNGKYFAKGEVVVIDENFGVRITSILSPEERLKRLR